ncbi:MAG: hemerythrin family protein [Aquificae bacterium]|nr:hemerythrin family protein [Aquificota bacterium]
MVKNSVSVVEWTPEMELGIPEIDAQHRKLVEMLNEFYRELEEGHEEEAVRRFFGELGRYVEEHFRYEERFMEEIGFPELENHKKTHRLFEKLYKEDLEKYLRGEKRALRELVALTLSWLYTHIMKTDKKYVRYMKEKGLL